MYRRLFTGIAVIFSASGLATAAFAQSAQDSAGWRKFGTSTGDQSYAVNQSVPQNSQPPQNYAPAAPVPSQITLPAGTFVRVRINEKLSSDKNQAGDFFTATLVQPLIANGVVIAQPGQNIAGRVSEAVRSKDGNGRSRLGLELTELSLVDGQQVPIRTQLMEYHRATNNGRDTGIIFGTTATGAAITTTSPKSNKSSKRSPRRKRTVVVVLTPACGAVRVRSTAIRISSNLIR